MNWVDGAQVLGSLTTAGALVFLGFQTKYSRDAATAAQRMHDLESARDAKTLDTDRRRHASQITAWPVELNTDKGKIWGIVINNASPSPVFDFVLTRAESRTRRDTLIPRISARAAVLPAGRYFAKEEQQWVEQLPINADARPISGNASYMAELRFRDSDGQAWQRDYDGVLSRADILSDRAGSADIQGS